MASLAKFFSISFSFVQKDGFMLMQHFSFWTAIPVCSDTDYKEIVLGVEVDVRSGLVRNSIAGLEATGT